MYFLSIDRKRINDNLSDLIYTFGKLYFREKKNCEWVLEVSIGTGTASAWICIRNPHSRNVDSRCGSDVDPDPATQKFRNSKIWFTKIINTVLSDKYLKFKKYLLLFKKSVYFKKILYYYLARHSSVRAWIRIFSIGIRNTGWKKYMRQVWNMVCT